MSMFAPVGGTYLHVGTQFNQVELLQVDTSMGSTYFRLSSRNTGKEVSIHVKEVICSDCSPANESYFK